MIFHQYFRSMHSAKHIFIFIFLLLIGNLSVAQGLYRQKFNGPYLLLFKLNDNQAEFLARHPDKIDSQFLYTRLVGKVHTDSIIPLWKRPIDEFPIKPFSNYNRYIKCQPRFHVWDIKENGYFIEVSVNGLNNVAYRLIENPLFNAGVHRIGYETFIFVEDTAGLPVYNAVVHLDTALCKYDSSVGGYKIAGDRIYGVLKIENKGVFTIQHLNGYRDQTNNTRPPRDNYRYAKIKYQGYLVTNKPRYKTWDTLFFKSFLVNRKGKPIKEKLRISLYQNGNVFYRTMQLKPTERGAYNGFFVISDSFILDQEMTIAIMNEHGSTIKSQNVMLENYELKDLFFELKADKKMVTPGGGIKFYVSATTANHLPIMDGKLTLKLKLSTVNYTDGDSVVIPFNKMENWYSVSVQTDPSGVTIFDIPDSVFIPLDGQFSVTCKLLTADNETRDAYVDFTYKTTRDRMEANLDGDTLRVQRFYNMKSVRKTMGIKLFSRKDLLVDSAIHTPLNLYLPPNIYMAQIFQGDTLVGTFYRQTTLPLVSGNRTHDSAHIYFTSQHDIPVFYRIYANNKLVAKGRTTKLEYHVFDKSKSSYHLQYGILEGSVTQPRFYSQSFHLAEKQLTVEIVQPGTVYPGQEIAIEIHVKDAYGKPVNKVNLAAWAVNTQLEGIVTPDVPYMGLVKTQKPLPTMSWPLVPMQKEFYGVLRNWQVGAFLLRKNEVFHMVFPKNGFEVLTDTTPYHTTEIEFDAHSAGNKENIIYVLANDTLLFAMNSSPKPGVLRIKPGKYNFTIRTFDRIFRFKDVEIIAGKKNFICLQTDTLKKAKSGDSALAGEFTFEELRLHFQHTLLFRYDQPVYDTLLIKVNGKLLTGFQPNYLSYACKSIRLRTKEFSPTTRKNNLTTFQDFMLFGLLNDGDEVEFGWKNNYSHQFTFHPGTMYSFTKNEMVKNEEKEWTNEIKYFGKFGNSQYTINQFWWDPYAPKPIIKPITEPVYAEPEHYIQNLPEFQYRDYRPGDKNILNSLLHLYLSTQYSPKRMWLFCPADSSLSIIENSNYISANYAEINMNAHQFIWTRAPQKQSQEFRLVMEMNDTTWLVKKIKMDSSVNLYLTIHPKEFRKLGFREHLLYDRLVKQLGREALNKFIDTPSINKGLFVIPIKQLNGTTGIDGTVTGPDLKYTVDNAFVVLERNGMFVRGAITNREGRFVMDNLQPGVYMLKIKGENYNYWIHYEVEIRAGYNHLVHAEMKPYAWFVYNKIAYDRDGDGVADMEPNSPIGETVDARGYSINGSAGAPSIAYSDEKVQYSMSAPSYNNVETISSKKKSFRSKAAGAVSPRYMQRAPDFDNDGVRDKFSDEADIEYKLPFKEAEQIELPGGWGSADGKKEENRLTEMAGDKNAKRTRKDFKDYAYWIPNLYTNKQGKTGYSIKYPDNVTSWQTFVPAMDGKRHSGLGQLVVRSYKPVTTSLALPFFLTEGDSLQAYGRVMNYTGKSLTGKYSLKYKGIGFDREINIKDFYTDSLNVIGGKPGDTISVESAFELANGYRDGELRKILVNAATVITGKSSFAEINRDTTMVFKADSNDLGMEVAVYNHKLAMILEILAQVENTPAYDNRSLASYLNALLIKKYVCTTLGMPFTNEKQIRETLSKLKKSQHDNGFFGFFKGSKSSFMVSTYAADVLYKAQLMGYENNGWLNAARIMEKQLPHVFGRERLAYLVSLKNMNRKIDYDSFMKALRPERMDKSQKLSYMKLLQLQGKAIKLNEIAEMLEPTYEGNLRVRGDWDWEFAPVTDDASNTYTAWEILFKANAQKSKRGALVDYLLSECGTYSSNLIKAAECMVKEAERDSLVGKDLKPEVYVNGTLVPVQNLPKIYRLKPGERLTMKHSGSAIYIAANRKFKTYKPESDATQFSMDVSITGVKGNHLTAGVPVEMKVTVFAKRNQFNSIIEVPIPAGCVFGPKIQSEGWVESHREYLTDRVLIFSDELPFGYHTFTIRLVPRFNGVFHTAPSRTALMFYPDKAAFTKAGRYTVSR